MPMNPRTLRPRRRLAGSLSLLTQEGERLLTEADEELATDDGAFDPRSIAGLELWLDASDQSTLFDADAGGSVVTADGAVGRWMDKSGKGRNFTQGTANNRPTWQATGRNGRGALLFDGSNDRLIGDGTQYVQTTRAHTAVFVHVVDSTAGVFPVLMTSVTNQAQQYRFINSSNASYLDYAAGSQSNFSGVRYTSAVRGSWRSVAYQYEGVSPKEAIRYTATSNNVALAQSSTQGFGPDGGASGAIGSESGGANLFKGQMAEILFYSRRLSSEELSALHYYVAAKWAL